jgi:hypothetical protein
VRQSFGALALLHFKETYMDRVRHLRWIAYLAIGVTLLALAVTGCGVLGGGNAPADSGAEPTATLTPRPNEPEAPENPRPTPRPDEDVGEQSLAGARDSYQETWNNYLRDSIAEQVADREQKISILERYQNPGILAANSGGLVEDISLLEDRTTFNLSNNGTFASAVANFDVRLTYVDGDTESRTCTPNVQIEFEPDDGLWYVINPAELQIFVNCIGR